MQQNIIVILIVLAIFAGIYWYYQYYSPTPVTLSPAPPGPALAFVEKLKSINIDTSFFDDPQFLALEDSPKLSLEGLLKGRTNPFLPLFTAKTK